MFGKKNTTHIVFVLKNSPYCLHSKGEVYASCKKLVYSMVMPDNKVSMLMVLSSTRSYISLFF